MYVPRTTPGLVIEPLLDERLILVATEPRAVGPGWLEDYVLVHWGDDFQAAHARAFPDMLAPTIAVGLGAIGLRTILDNGGSGYFLEFDGPPPAGAPPPAPRERRADLPPPGLPGLPGKPGRPRPARARARRPQARRRRPRRLTAACSAIGGKVNALLTIGRHIADPRVDAIVEEARPVPAAAGVR